MSRPWVGLQLVLGWLPVWALYTTLILASHPGTSATSAAIRGLWVATVAALLGIWAWRLTSRFPWPRTFRWQFLLTHLVCATIYATLFTILTVLIEVAHAVAFAAFTGHAVIPLSGPSVSAVNVQVLSTSWLFRFFVTGVWFYVMVAGVAYATRATERAARAEALAATAQLAALRAQLHPHFLFNALHTVVHLIPREPARAAQAAEQVAGMLRAAIDEDRDVVTVAEEWAFVEQYLEIERLRFGDRLQVRSALSNDAVDAELPSFAIQTLVENAVRHGAGPKVEPTELEVTARRDQQMLVVTVHDTGQGCDAKSLEGGRPGTGLQRLRERLAVLYGSAARLDLESAPGAGFAARLAIPQPSAGDQ